MGHRMTPPDGSARRVRARTCAACVCAATVALLGGCGTMRGQIGTTVNCDLSISRRFELVATGLLATLLAGDESVQQRYAGGDGVSSEVEAYWEGEEYHLQATVYDIPARAWLDANEDESIARSYWWLVSYYSYTARRETSSGGAPTAEEGLESSLNAATEAMYRFREEVVMPGAITASNATTVRGSRAVWDIGATQVGRGYSIQVRSRRINIPELLITALLLAAVGGLVSRHRLLPEA